MVSVATISIICIFNINIATPILIAWKSLYLIYSFIHMTVVIQGVVLKYVGKLKLYKKYFSHFKKTTFTSLIRL